MAKKIEYKGISISSCPQKSQKFPGKYFCKGYIEGSNGYEALVFDIANAIPDEKYKCNDEDEADTIFIEHAKQYIDNL